MEKNNKSDSSKKWLITGISVLSVTTIVFASLFIWKMLTSNNPEQPGPTSEAKLTINLDKCTINGSSDKFEANYRKGEIAKVEVATNEEYGLFNTSIETTHEDYTFVTSLDDIHKATLFVTMDSNAEININGDPNMPISFDEAKKNIDIIINDLDIYYNDIEGDPERYPSTFSMDDRFVLDAVVRNDDDELVHNTFDGSSNIFCSLENNFVKDWDYDYDWEEPKVYGGVKDVYHVLEPYQMQEGDDHYLGYTLEKDRETEFKKKTAKDYGIKDPTQYLNPEYNYRMGEYWDFFNNRYIQELSTLRSELEACKNAKERGDETSSKIYKVLNLGVDTYIGEFYYKEVDWRGYDMEYTFSFAISEEQLISHSYINKTYPDNETHITQESYLSNIKFDEPVDVPEIDPDDYGKFSIEFTFYPDDCEFISTTAIQTRKENEFLGYYNDVFEFIYKPNDSTKEIYSCESYIGQQALDSNPSVEPLDNNQYKITIDTKDDPVSDNLLDTKLTQINILIQDKS